MHKVVFAPVEEKRPLLNDDFANEEWAREKSYPALSPKSLLTAEEIPSWQYNQYIETGYRPTSDSLEESIDSSLHFHNETGNIQTHLIGAFIFACIPWHFYTYYYQHTRAAELADVAVMSIYAAGVATCFLLSSACHMTTALALCCCIVTSNPRATSPEFNVIRTLMYTALGIWSAVYVMHGLILRGWDTQMKSMSIDWMGVTALLNSIGAMHYACRVPERWFPGRLDFIGHSHQLFHIAVVLAGLAFYQGLLRSFVEVRQNGLACTV
ncbi:MAG: hypothetical protein Q9162_005299 [Coniocarpon cinnabarinum]